MLLRSSVSAGLAVLSVYSATKAAPRRVYTFPRSRGGALGGKTSTPSHRVSVDTDTELMVSAASSETRSFAAVPCGALADIDDVAEAVEFLLSSRSKNITGTVLTDAEHFGIARCSTLTDAPSN